MAKRFSRQHIAIMSISGLLLAVFVISLWRINQAEMLQMFAVYADALRQHPQWFVAGMALVTAAILPPFPIIILGGFLFGAVKGTALSSLAYLLGAVASFFIGRFLTQATVSRISQKYPLINALNFAVKRKGFLMVLLSRLALVLPYNILNIALGASRVSLRNYIVGTSLGTLPIITINSMLGAAAPSLLNILNGSAKLEINGGWVMLVAATMIALLIAVVRWSGKQLHDARSYPDHSGNRQ